MDNVRRAAGVCPGEAGRLSQRAISLGLAYSQTRETLGQFWVKPKAAWSHLDGLEGPWPRR